ncbi:MAG: hypothetical protein ACJ79G_00310 [Myxococcales bacterium]
MPDDDDKPKRTKSWREIDKMRDKSGSSRRSDRESERFQTSTKYTQYKTNLDRLFSQGVASSALPDHLREKLTAPGDAAKDDERKKLYAIEDPKAFYAAATEYLKSHPLPDDARILDRLLGHPDDDLVEKALTRLEEMHKAGTLKVPPSLSQRLASVEIESGLPAVRRRAADLRKAIR